MMAEHVGGAAHVSPLEVRSTGVGVADPWARIGGTGCELGTKSGCSASSRKCETSNSAGILAGTGARNVAFKTDTEPQTGVIPQTPRMRSVCNARGH